MRSTRQLEEREHGTRAHKLVRIPFVHKVNGSEITQKAERQAMKKLGPRSGP